MKKGKYFCGIGYVGTSIRGVGDGKIGTVVRCIVFISLTTV